MDFMLFISTAGSQAEGERIAKALVRSKLAACINVIPGAVSFFSWEGKICREKETLLLIKSRKGVLKKIINKIKEMNSYSVPEGIYIKVDGGEKNYLDWVRKSMKAQK